MYEDDDDTPAQSTTQAQAPTMTIDVKVSDFDMNSLARHVAEKMAERVLRDKAAEIQRMADELVTERALQMIDAAITPVVADALSRPITPTDIFGRAKGEACSVSDYIARGAQAYLETRIDPNGKPTSDSFWGKPEYSRISRFVADTVDKKFDEEMQQAVKSIKAEVRAEMRKAAMTWLAQFQAKTVDSIAKA